jgi:DHA1 family bicyclomycin/chloramphenicol resistance-like MFS transporter
VRPRAQWRLLALLIAITAVGPLSLNILCARNAGPDRHARRGAGTVQLTLSLFLLGMAISQLVLGTLSDRFGRRPSCCRAGAHGRWRASRRSRPPRSRA